MTGIELANWFREKSNALGIDMSNYAPDPVRDDIIRVWALQDAQRANATPPESEAA